MSRTSLFGALSHEVQAALAEVGQPQHFLAGSLLMRQGDASDCMHVILDGHVRVERRHPAIREALILEELGAGDVVGEMGVLDEEPRSATVVAIEDTDTLQISATAVDQIMLKFPEVSAALLRLLSRRLRSTDELASHLKSAEG